MTVPELDRIEALLDLTGRPSFTSGSLQPSAESLGAVAGVAYSDSESAAVISVYVFDGYDQAADGAQKLTAAADSNTTVETTVNGGLLLWATAPSDDQAAVSAIEGLAGDFAGRE